MNIGVAAHITAAAPKGPRYDESLTKEEREGIDNGLWLCWNCSQLIDKDPADFPVELLREWKGEAERRARDALGKPGDGSERFHDVIDSAAAFLKERKLDIGIDRLLTLKRRSWNKLDNRQRYRTLANLGAAYEMQNELSKAAQCYYDAGRHQPADPDAQAFVARALEYEGRSEEAFELASDLVKNMRCGRASLTYVRLAPAEHRAAQLLKDVNLWPEQIDAQVQVAVRAINERDFDTARDAAEALIEHDPSIPEGPFFLGKIEYIKAILPRHVSSTQRPAELDVAKVEVGLAYAAQALESAKRAGRSDVAAQAHLLRHDLKLLARDRESALVELEAAARLAPSHPDILIARAEHLAPSAPGQAATLLREAYRLTGDHRARVALAHLLAEQGSSPGEALELFEIVSRDVGPFRLDAISKGFSLARATGNERAQQAFLSASKSAAPCLEQVFLADVALQTGDADAASEALARALELASATEQDAATRRHLVHTLVEAKMNAEALAILQGLVVPGIPDNDLSLLLDLAEQLGQHDVILTRSSELRENGYYIPEILLREARLLEAYDPESGFEILESFIVREPENRMARLLYHRARAITGREPTVADELDRLPRPEDERAAATAVVSLLLRAGEHPRALEYGYKMLCAHDAEPEAHRAYITLYGEVQPFVDISQPSEAAADVAVEYLDLGADASRHWVVLEGETDVACLPDAAAPGSELAKRFAGSEVDDVLVLSEGIEPRRVRVLRLQSKFAYRLNKSASEYQRRFPDRHEVQMVSVGEGESSLRRVLDNNAMNDEEALRTYRSLGRSLFELAETTSSHVFESHLRLIGAEDEAVLSGPLDDERFRSQVAALDASDRVVLSPTCFGSILVLELEEKLQDWGWSLLITPSTREVARAMIAEYRKDGPARFIGKQGQDYYAVERDVDGARRLATRVEKLVALAEVTSSRQLAALQNEERELWRLKHGVAGAESFGVSLEDNTVVWSDDLLYCLLAERDGGSCVTTHALIEAASKRGLARDDADELQARLLGYGYIGPYPGEGPTKAVCRLASWDPGMFPLKQLLDRIARPQVPWRVAASTCLCVLYEISDELSQPSSRASSISSVLERVAGHPEGQIIIRAVYEGIPERFGLNVVRGLETRKLVAAWWHSSGPRSLIVL